MILKRRLLASAARTFFAAVALSPVAASEAPRPGLAITHLDANTPRNVQVAIAKAAAPGDISKHATILVLGHRGYEVAVRGSNGFTCFIERWYPGEVAPQCMDAEGSRTTLKTRVYLEQRRAQGAPDAAIMRELAAGYRSGRFLAPARPGINYMHSPYNRAFVPALRRVVPQPAHYMFYAPGVTEASVGRKVQGAPDLLFPGRPDAYFVVVPVTGHSH